MLGFKLFRHALLMLIQNFKQAVQLIVAPMVILVGIFLAIMALLATTGIGLADFGSDVSSDWLFRTPQFWISVIVGFTGAIAVICGMIVNWHRYVLLQEPVGWWTSPFRSGQLAGYVKLGLVVCVISTVIFVVIGALAGAFAGAFGNPIVFVVLFALFGGPAYVFVVRLSLSLPSQAIGSNVSMSEASVKTKGAFWTILIALICVTVFNFLLNIVETGMQYVSGFLGVMTSLAFLPINMLLFASLLTTLYGYYIEKRDLM
jgi:hypothetical protein